MKNTLLLIISMVILSPASAFAADEGNFTPPEEGVWYRIYTRYNGSDSRSGTCIQYLPDATGGSLFVKQPVDQTSPDYDCQLWRFEKAPDGSSDFALVCKAAPDGYLSDIPVYRNDSGEFVPVVPGRIGSDSRWVYMKTTPENVTDKYGFEFFTEEGMGGTDSTSGESYSAITTKYVKDIAEGDTSKAIFMNAGAARVNYAVNLWSQSYDDNANEWVFSFSKEMENPSTGVEEFRTDNKEEPVIYDVMGRKLTKPVKGINIINGKKVIMRF